MLLCTWYENCPHDCQAFIRGGVSKWFVPCWKTVPSLTACWEWLFHAASPIQKSQKACKNTKVTDLENAHFSSTKDTHYNSDEAENKHRNFIHNWTTWGEEYFTTAQGSATAEQPNFRVGLVDVTAKPKWQECLVNNNRRVQSCLLSFHFKSCDFSQQAERRNVWLRYEENLSCRKKNWGN